MNQSGRGLLPKAEVTTYREDNMYWAEASGTLALAAECAWKSLDQLLLRIIDIPMAAGKSIKLIRVKDDAPITHVGNELVARAAMLKGVIKASMSMKVTECVPERYLRLNVHTYNMAFAVIDFRIQSTESGCRLTFRQGFRSRKSMPRHTESQESAKTREMPETERIFNLWTELAEAGSREQGCSAARLSGTRSG